MKQDLTSVCRQARHFGAALTALHVLLSLMIGLGMLGCGPPGSLPGFDTARCILEPATVSYSDHGFDLGYECAGQTHTFSAILYTLPESHGAIDCEFISHDFDLPILDPPPFIWAREGSDPRCMEYVEAVGSGTLPAPQPSPTEPDTSPLSPEGLEGNPDPNTNETGKDGAESAEGAPEHD